jgi:cyclophilin family peptidyl-prolyl cis-trans isomerase
MKYIHRIICLFVVSIIATPVYSQTGIDKPQYEIITKRAGTYLGTFNIELFPLIAPLHVNNFDSLVSVQFYDSTAFLRVVPGFVIQGGDPNSISGPKSTWGQGQPWQPTVPAEFSPARHVRGILGAARGNNINSATSQYYICVANALFLDNNYTVYGKVTNGMDVVDTIVTSPRDANDNPFQKIEMFVTYTGVNDSIPDTPNLTFPANGSVNLLNNQTFTCAPVQGAILYEFEFSTDSTFATIDFVMETGTNSVNTVQAPITGFTKYFWRVIANNGGHKSLPSSYFNFTSAVSPPVLVFPSNGSTGIITDPVFTWMPAPGATGYNLQVSVASTFTIQNMVYNQTGLIDTFQVVPGLNPNSIYYWRMRGENGTTLGSYSTKFSFTTGTGVGIAEIENSNTSFAINNIYPLPVSEKINLDLFIKKEGRLSISIYDLLDRLAYTKESDATYGENKIIIPANKLTNGSYMLTIRLNDNIITRPIQVNRVK